MKKLELTGMKFGDWAVLGEGERGKYKGGRSNIYWICKCKHGKIRELESHEIKGPKSVGCGCIKKYKKRKPPVFKIGQKIDFITITNIGWYEKYRMYNYFYICDCGKRGNLITRNIWKSPSCGCRGLSYMGICIGKWNSIKTRAAVFNRKFDITINYAWQLYLKQKGKCKLSGIKLKLCRDHNNNTASLDRIDSSKGYIEGNIQWVHKDINLMKNNFSDKEFIEMCSKVYLYSISNKIFIIKHEFGKFGKKYVTALKQTAKIRNFEFLISYDFLWDLFLKQKGICALSGEAIHFGKWPSYKYFTSKTASVDRIDAKIGYLESNVRWIHKHINEMKLNYTDEEFLYYCEKIYKHSLEGKNNHD